MSPRHDRDRARTRDGARAIADAFLQETLGVAIASDSARYEAGPDATWVFTYPIEREAGAVTDPSHHIVVVTVSDGRAHFFDVM